MVTMTLMIEMKEVVQLPAAPTETFRKTGHSHKLKHASNLFLWKLHV